MRTSSLGVMLGLSVALLACSSSRDVTRIRLGHGLGESHPVHQALLHLARRVDERSAGRLSVEVYPAEQLGSERECLELLQIGSLGMTKVSAAVLENFDRRFQVFSVPYLFRDDAHRFAVLRGEIGRELLLSAGRYRLRGLAYYDAGSRSFYTTSRPIRTPADLVGLKIRTQESPSAMALVNQLGGAATPISWGELYTALAQGVVDGAENNPPSFQLSRHYEVSRYLSLDEHTAVPDVLLISSAVWDRLDDRARGWLAAAVEDSVEVQRQLWRAATDEALAAVQAAGIELVRPDKAPFVAGTEAMRRDLARDPELGPLLRRVQEAGS